MAAGIVFRNVTTASGVTLSMPFWVPDTGAPTVGDIAFHKLADSAGAEFDLSTLVSRGYVSTATFTPAAAAYGGGDIMEGAKQFQNIGPALGGQVIIRSIVFEIPHTALVASEAAYTLQLYNVTPPSALADNDPWDLPSGDRTAHVCSLNLGTPVDLGSTLKIETDNINKQITVPSGGSLWGYLYSVAGITPTAVARKAAIHTERV